MKIPRLLAISTRVFHGLKNDRRSLALIGIVPVTWMCIFGLAFSGEVRDVRVIVVNHDRGYSVPGTNLSISSLIIEHLAGGVLDTAIMASVDVAVEEVRAGRSAGVVVFPADFTRDAVMGFLNPGSREKASILLRLDESDVNIANTIRKEVGDALVAAMNASGRGSPVTIDAGEAIYAKDARFIDALVPGVLGFATYLVATMLTLISFVGERTRGTLERLLSTPVTEAEVIGGYALAFGLVSILQVILLLVVATLAFNIMIVGNLALAFVVAALLAVVGQSLGILLSNAAKREAQAMQLFPLVVMPAFLLSGVFWPLQAVPPWLRPVSYLIPTSYAVEALRSVMLRGWGLGMVWHQVLALIVFAAVFLVAATFSLRLGRR